MSFEISPEEKTARRKRFRAALVKALKFLIVACSIARLAYAITGNTKAFFGIFNAMVIGIAASGKLGKKTENGIWDLRRVVLGADAVKLISPLRTRTIPYLRIDSIVAREAEDEGKDRDTREKALIKGSGNQTLAIVRLDVANFGEMVDELIRRVGAATSRERTRVISNRAARVRQLTIRKKRLVRWGAALLIFFVLLGTGSAWTQKNRRSIAGGETARATVRSSYIADHGRHHINYSFEDAAGRTILGAGEVPSHVWRRRDTIWIHYDPQDPRRNQPVETPAGDLPLVMLFSFLLVLPCLGMLLYGHFGISPDNDAANVAGPR